MSLKNIAVVGGSGNLGALILPALIKANFHVVAVTRETSTAKFAADTTVVKSSFTLDSLTEVFRGQDAVISMLPITALAEQGTVIDAAIAAGVKRFFPSEYGSDSANPAVIAAVPFFEAKMRYLDYLRSKEDVISWTGLITGPFFDWGIYAGFIGFDLASKTATLLDDGHTRFTTSNAAQIARAFIAVLQSPSATANQLIFVQSFTTTQVEVLGALEKATDEKWNVVHKRSEDVRAFGLKALQDGDLLVGGGSLITAAVLGRDALEDHTHVEGGLWNQRLGLPEENVEEEVARIVHPAAAQVKG
ncbi:isoflavone reductase [Phlyctema vagabunda]|uniref:Isoflavone reductase n=1 Tax=Phlyctema vagabunda TaxID=108571 RepID=A0ABR4PCU3_9HELO